MYWFVKKNFFHLTFNHDVLIDEKEMKQTQTRENVRYMHNDNNFVETKSCKMIMMSR